MKNKKPVLSEIENRCENCERVNVMGFQGQVLISELGIVASKYSCTACKHSQNFSIADGTRIVSSKYW